MNLRILTVAIIAAHGALAVGTNDQVEADIDYGTFQNPSANVRPRFRYWVNDASMNLSIVAEDVKQMGQLGAGGLELLGYYFYGEASYSNPVQPSLQTDWTKYGFGGQAWKDLLHTVLATAKKYDLIVDLSMGPNQGAGVPAPYDDDGLLWDLAAYNQTVAIGSSFNGTIPGWGSGPLVAAVVGVVVNSTDSAHKTLAESSLVDVTDRVSKTGELQVQFNNTDGVENIVFSYYLIHSEYREVQSPNDVPAAVPQSPVTTYAQNGSWVVDHYSAKGAQVVIDFWNQSLLDGEISQLIREVGNYLWEDSQEFSVSTWWTPRFQQVFHKNRGYSINKYLPIVATSDVIYVTDETDAGASHITDYQQTLTELNSEYLDALTEWSQSLDIQFSSQVVYNLAMDMLANIPHVNGPECETLGFGDNMDSYRQFAGPAHLAGKRIISNEAGAEFHRVYEQPVSEVVWSLNRALATSVNQFILHGYPNSGNYGNTTWPGFTTFEYQFSEMYGPRQPAFAFYSDFINWLARNQLVSQTGIPKVDIAFWSKSTSYRTVPTVYSSVDLQEAGYSYEYLSPDNFGLPEAYVSKGIFAPNRQAFKALIIWANETLTSSGTAKLVDYAHGGLPIIFSGGLLSNFSGYNPAAKAAAIESIKNLTSLSNVHVVPYNGLAATLQSLQILPRASTTANGTWFTYWRHDRNASIDYVFVYNDAAGVPSGQGLTNGSISFETTGKPFLYNAWSGEVTAISSYRQSDTHTEIPLQLAGNQSVIIGFHHTPEHQVHIQEGADGVTSVTEGTKSLAVRRSFDQESRTVRLSNGHSVTLAPMLTPAFTLGPWNLTVESWEPPSDIYNVELGPTRRNSTFQVPTLLPWNQISSSLTNISGVGYYTTTFNWPPQSTLLSSSPASHNVSGAVIDLGQITHTARVTVNGQALPPLDITWARYDIGPLLQDGENTVQVVVSTPLGNGLRTYWDQLATSGVFASDIIPPPGEADYGLISPVQIVAYRTDRVE